MRDISRSVDRDDVKTAGTAFTKPFAKQIILCNFDDLLLLPPVHMLFTAAAISGASVFHLDEHQGLFIVHDEVDLPAADAEISLPQTEALLLQIDTGRLFKAAADLSFIQFFLSGGNGLGKSGGRAGRII